MKKMKRERSNVYRLTSDDNAISPMPFNRNFVFDLGRVDHLKSKAIFT